MKPEQPAGDGVAGGLAAGRHQQVEEHLHLEVGERLLGASTSDRAADAAVGDRGQHPVVGLGPLGCSISSVA